MIKYIPVAFLMIISSLVKAQCNVPLPIYSDHSLNGRAEIRIYVNQDGNVSRSEVFKSSGSDLLDKSALEASLKIKCKPLLEDGKPVAFKAVQPYVFSDKFEERVALDKEIISIIHAKGLGKNSRIAKRMGCYMPEASRPYLTELKPKVPSVIMQIIVDTEGKYLSSEIIRGSDRPELNEAAIAASKLFSCPFNRLNNSQTFVHGYLFF